MIRYKLDASASSVVGLCREPGCYYRALASTTQEARALRDQHEEDCHLTRGRHATRRAIRRSSRNSGRSEP